MNTEGSAATSVNPGVITRGFRAIEALNEFHAVNGWDADYRQIEPGPLTVELASLKLGHIELFRARMNRRLESSTTSIKSAYSLITALSDSPLHIDGTIVGRQDLLLVPPNTQLDIVTTAGAHAFTIHVPADRIGDYGTAFGDVNSLSDIVHMSLHSTPSVNVDVLRRMVFAVFNNPGNAEIHGNMHWTLMTALTDMLKGRASTGNGDDVYGRLAKRRIILCAKKYVRWHLPDEIRVTDLCEFSGVSQSTLERAFRRELDISPQHYIVATRLHEVRRKLVGAETEPVSIAEIALNCGFTHMGRFSRQYRDQFGRLPSEERHPGVQLKGEDQLP